MPNIAKIYGIAFSALLACGFGIHQILYFEPDIDDYYHKHPIAERCSPNSIQFYSSFLSGFYINDEGIFIKTPNGHFAKTIMKNEELSTFDQFTKLKSDQTYPIHKMLALDGWLMKDAECSGMHSELFFVKSLRLEK